MGEIDPTHNRSYLRETKKPVPIEIIDLAKIQSSRSMTTLLSAGVCGAKN